MVNVGEFIGDIMRAAEEIAVEYKTAWVAMRWINAALIGLCAFFGLHIN